MGWGAHKESLQAAHGQQYHINHLELFAAFLGLQTFVASRRDIPILLRLDQVQQSEQDGKTPLMQRGCPNCPWKYETGVAGGT